ncbi:MAG: hypothetical protein LBJ67_07170 [Planctomycetaceae bacterium]|jgi:Flp pilus assembly protein TadB|nr:hypothetical protein [Planctomycetaceae bacterium]
MYEIVTILATQCPVLGGLIWFLIVTTRENNRRFDEQSRQFQAALDKIVEKIGDRISDRLDKIEDSIKNN